jgi:hypothetical protein
LEERFIGIEFVPFSPDARRLLFHPAAPLAQDCLYEESKETFIGAVMLGAASPGFEVFLYRTSASGIGILQIPEGNVTGAIP